MISQGSKHLPKRRLTGKVWPSAEQGSTTTAEREKLKLLKKSPMRLPSSLWDPLYLRTLSLDNIDPRRRLLAAINIFLCLLTIGQWTLLLASPCRNFEGDFAECQPQYQVVGLMDSGKTVATCLVGAYLLAPYVVRSLRAGRLTRDAAKRVFGSSFAVKPGEWTLAASRCVFAESMRVTRAAQVMAVVTGVVMLAGSGVVAMGAGVSKFLSETASQDDAAPSAMVCGAEASACRVLYHVRGFLWLAAGSLYVLALMTLATPIQLWSDAALQALASTDQPRLLQLKNLPAQMSVSFVVHLAAQAVEMSVLRGAHTQAAWVIYTFSACNLLQSLANILLATWTVTLPVWATEVSDVSMRSACLTRKHHRCLEQAWPDAEAQCDRPAHRGCKSHGFRFETGYCFQIDIFLQAGVMLWTWREVTSVTSGPAHAAIWGVRLIIMASMLWLCKDPVATFDCLDATDAGFGLLVDAKQLQKAIQTNLTTGVAHSQTLKMHRGSFTRMQEALVVSYKWQNVAREVARDVWLNMSDWQLTELRRAIANSTARYVWIDKLSVPQTTHDSLKTELIARMMAVYATAGYTIALRSIEPEGYRYHQRGWTLQEFCAAPRLKVVTEVEEDGEDEYRSFRSAYDGLVEAARQKSATVTTTISTPELVALHLEASVPRQDSFPEITEVEEEQKFAVEISEEEAAIRQRLWCQARAPNCVPFWLSNGVANANQAARKGMHKKYRVLSAITRTTHGPDHVRALYPLVSNCPVEHQEELLALVDQICEPLGIKDRKAKALRTRTRM